MLKIGIIGAGRMGSIRALSALAHPRCRVTWVSDVLPERALALASQVGAKVADDWRPVIVSNEVDAVVVATTHRHLSEITVSAINAGKHVFCEKPAARDFREADEVVRALRKGSGQDHSFLLSKVIVGYTLRHRLAVQKAWQLVRSGDIGQLLYVRGRYGHGGRAGYGDEWRTSPEEAGGGELLDQGVHLIDLSRCFLGNFTKTSGTTKCFHWSKGRSEVEDNAFMLLETAEEKVALLHASWTQWKNLFSFEIFGELGAILIEGLGGHYGTEILRLVKRRPAGGSPETTEFEFPSSRRAGLDEVWGREWGAFVSAILANNDQISRTGLPAATAEDAREVLAIVGKLYQCVKSDSFLAVL